MVRESVNHKCSFCKRTNIRQYSWIDPNKFADPKKAIMTSAFHCIFCSRGQALKIQFFPEEQIKFIEQIEFRTLIKDDPAPFYIGGSSSEETSMEVLSEDAALSMLVDE